jgi:hypothetical protein
MKTCHVCLCECEDYAELCPVCGADLTGVENSETENVIDRVIEKPVLLATLDDVVSAEILRDILNSNGIPNSGSESDGGAMKVVFGGGFVAEEIYVDSCDYEKAEELYNEFLNSAEEFDGEFFDEEFAEDEE